MNAIISILLNLFVSSANAETVGSVDWSRLQNAPTINLHQTGLPSCASLEKKEAPGLPGVRAYRHEPCIGQTSKPAEPAPITISEVILDRLKNSTTAEDIKKLADRYPVLKAAAVIGALCRPTGKSRKITGAYCKYSTEF